MNTHEQLERKIAELHEKMFALQKEIEGVESELVKAKDAEEWPEIGDSNCYLSSDGSIWHGVWNNETIENLRLSIGNCFKTKEEAEFAAERLKVLAEMRKFTTNKQFGEIHPAYTIVIEKINLSNCDFAPDDYIVEPSISLVNCGILPLFETESDVRACISAIGEERLKKYYFGVKE